MFVFVKFCFDAAKIIIFFILCKGLCFHTGGLAWQTHCTQRVPHKSVGGKPGTGADGWPIRQSMEMGVIWSAANRLLERRPPGPVQIFMKSLKFQKKRKICHHKALMIIRKKTKTRMFTLMMTRKKTKAPMFTLMVSGKKAKAVMFICQALYL